jgi:hypothetical protein
MNVQRMECASLVVPDKLKRITATVMPEPLKEGRATSRA